MEFLFSRFYLSGEKWNIENEISKISKVSFIIYILIKKYDLNRLDTQDFPEITKLFDLCYTLWLVSEKDDVSNKRLYDLKLIFDYYNILSREKEPKKKFFERHFRTPGGGVLELEVSSTATLKNYIDVAEKLGEKMFFRTPLGREISDLQTKIVTLQAQYTQGNSLIFLTRKEVEIPESRLKKMEDVKNDLLSSGLISETALQTNIIKKNDYLIEFNFPEIPIDTSYEQIYINESENLSYIVAQVKDLKFLQKFWELYTVQDTMKDKRYNILGSSEILFIVDFESLVYKVGDIWKAGIIRADTKAKTSTYNDKYAFLPGGEYWSGTENSANLILLSEMKYEEINNINPLSTYSKITSDRIDRRESFAKENLPLYLTRFEEGFLEKYDKIVVITTGENILVEKLIYNFEVLVGEKEKILEIYWGPGIRGFAPSVTDAEIEENKKDYEEIVELS